MIRVDSARQAAYQAITRIESDGAFSDLVINHLLDKRVDTRDNALISEMVRGTIRWKKQLQWIINSFLDKPQNIPDKVHWLLWLGVFQILHMNIPDFAAVNETVEIAKQNFNKWTRLVNGVLRSVIRKKDQISYPDPQKEPVMYIAVSQSHPEWMVERWINQFGFDTTLALCKANNEIPTVTIRLNPLQIDEKQFSELIQSSDSAITKGTLPGFYHLSNINYQDFHTWLEKGLITVQDESAGLVSYVCAPKPGDIIVDLCAAPGGKTTHLAELANDQVKVLAGEINHARTGLIFKAAQRLHLQSVYPLVADGKYFPAKQADIVLLDAPCSGLGVLRKKPDMRWNRKPEEIQRLNLLQYDLLKKAAAYVKQNGHLVYSTCTIDPQENEQIIERFLSEHKHFKTVDPGNEYLKYKSSGHYIRTWPHLHQMDGSFMVKMIHQEELL